MKQFHPSHPKSSCRRGAFRSLFRQLGLFLAGVLLALPTLGLDGAALLEVVRAHPGDSTEVKALNSLYRIHRKKDPDRAVQYLGDALSLAQEIDFRKGEALAYRAYGDHYNSRGEPALALESLQQSHAIYKDLGDAKGVISCINGFGNTAVRQGNFTLALEHYLAEARHCEAIGFEEGLATAYQNVSGIHFRQQQFDRAREYVQKSLRIKESRGDSAAMVPSLNALSVTYTAQGAYREALRIQARTLVIAREYSNPKEVASLLNNMGVQHHYLQQLDSAEHYYRRALAINQRIDERQEVATLYINLGELACQQGQGRQAVAYCDSSLAITAAVGAQRLVAEGYRGRSNALAVLGDYQAALKWSEKYHALKDSLSGERTKLAINELQIKYDAGQKDIEIAQLREQEATASSQAEKRKFLLALTVGGALLLAFGGLAWVGKNRIQEKQRRIVLEQKALRTQMNPHFIFNSLGAMQSMYMSGETDLANNYMGDFGKLMRKILDNSGKETISVQEELEMLRLYLDLEKGRNHGQIDYDISVDERIDPRGMHIPPMVIQPFLENAIWHGILPSKRPGHIQLRLALADRPGYLCCTVEDNGIGIASAPGPSQHTSRGIDITEQRLGTKVQFSPLSPGTRVTFDIPL